MKRLSIAIFNIILSQLCYGQDSIKVFRQYEKDKPETKVDSIFNSIQNTFFLSLDEGFADSVRITVNQHLVFDGYLKTDESIGLAKTILISFKNPGETMILKIQFVNTNRYIFEKLDLSYKSLQVRGLRPWSLIYTNQFPIRM